MLISEFIDTNFCPGMRSTSNAPTPNSVTLTFTVFTNPDAVEFCRLWQRAEIPYPSTLAINNLNSYYLEKYRRSERWLAELDRIRSKYLYEINDAMTICRMEYELAEFMDIPEIRALGHDVVTPSSRLQLLCRITLPN